VCVDDRTTDRKAHAESALLRGEERLKDLFGSVRREPYPGIRDVDLDAAVVTRE
jgi:hypothetical protein